MKYKRDLTKLLTRVMSHDRWFIKKMKPHGDSTHVICQKYATTSVLTAIASVEKQAEQE